MKKTITILFSTQNAERLNNDIVRDLRLVLGNSVNIQTVFLQQLKPGEQIQGDAVLIMRPSIKQLAQQHIVDSTCVVVTRTLTEESVYKLYGIPRGSRVLVVNESRETTMETVSMLYQLGIEHLKLVPYMETDEDIIDIQTAITPGEMQCVPNFIPNVIDLGNRRLDMQTFLDLFDLLHLNNDAVKQNLILYADTIIELHAGVKKRYTDSYMLNKILNQTLNLQKNGVVVTDVDFHMNYWNSEVERMLEQTPAVGKLLSDYFSKENCQKMMSVNFSKDLFRITGKQIMVTRFPLKAMKSITGYSFQFDSAVQIRKSGSELSTRLKRQGLTARYTFQDILYQSQAMEDCVAIAKKVAQSDYTILITGETGTGKEMFAQAIHNASLRSNMPFVAVNCAALPENLLESELFGYEEGAFTGARRGGKIGLFEQADGGSIFLDEIGDMPYALQSKLLRVLQEQQIVRLGGNSVIDVNVRILTATNCDLKEMIREKKFREDLFYRLNVFPLKLIPLRQRKQDIVPLFCTLGDIPVETLSPEYYDKLIRYPWPGNVRELRNAVDYYNLMGTLDCLQMETFCGGDPELEMGVSSEKLKELIMEIVRRRTQEQQRTGRGTLLQELRYSGVQVSENRLESTLADLQQEKKLNRGKGRAGLSPV